MGASAVFKLRPALTEEQRRWMISHFRSYMFFDRDSKTRRVRFRCSHCGYSGSMSELPRVFSADDFDLFHCSHGKDVVCPTCGLHAQAINTKVGFSKEKTEDHCFVFPIAKSEDEVWLVCECMYTKHSAVRCSLAFFDFSFETYTSCVYRLRPGECDLIMNWIGFGPSRQERIIEPFCRNYCYGAKYDPYFIAPYDLSNTFLRYHSYDLYPKTVKSGLKFCTYMAYLAEYPVIEQLLKAGYLSIVKDLLCSGIKNASFFDFSAPSLKEGFKVPGQVLARWRKEDKALHPVVLRYYMKHYRLLGPSRGYDHARMRFLIMDQSNGRFYFDSLRRYVDSEHIDTERFVRYIAKQVKKLDMHEREACRTAGRLYLDYIRFGHEANALTDQENVLFPPHLQEAHDRMVSLRNEIVAEREAKRERSYIKFAKELYDDRTRLYGLSDEKFTIVIPTSPAEIRDEGKALSHCVGGYAERHCGGETTILFIRFASHPDVPYFTAEMQGSRCVQIYGFKNCGIDSDDLRNFWKTFLSVVKHRWNAIKNKNKKKERVTA